MRYLTFLLFFTALLPLSLAEARADSLLIDTVESDNGVQRPGRGQSMDHVRRIYGEPASIVPAVGDPPITRWVYKRFTVYFEHQVAITSVVKR